MPPSYTWDGVRTSTSFSCSWELLAFWSYRTDITIHAARPAVNDSWAQNGTQHSHAHLREIGINVSKISHLTKRNHEFVSTYLCLNFNHCTEWTALCQAHHVVVWLLRPLNCGRLCQSVEGAKYPLIRWWMMKECYLYIDICSYVCT